MDEAVADPPCAAAATLARPGPPPGAVTVTCTGAEVVVRPPASVATAVSV